MPVKLPKMTITEKKLIYIQNIKPFLNKRALFSDGTENYVSPAEPEPFSDVKIRFRTAKGNADMVYMCHYHGEILMDLVESDSLFDYYEAVIHLTDKPLRYYFKIISGFEVCYYNQWGAYENHEDHYAFVLQPGFKTPDWAKGAVMYQIYVDRFCDGDPSNNVEDREYTYIDAYSSKVTDWNKYPATMGVREFYGGDLQGVLNKMDYLQELGVEAIYFNPLFVSPSNHKYDIQDYDYIDPHFGKIVVDEGKVLDEGDMQNAHATKYISRVTDKRNLEASNELFIKLVDEAHKRGIKVIIDGVFNHSGSFNKWMDRERIYENQEGYEKGAFISKDSPYHSFYKFYEEDSSQWPYNTSYDGWWAHDTLPKLNYEASEKLEKYILDIARKWVSPPYNVDGWRLDVAADLGHSAEYNHNFWRKFRTVVKEANPNAIILAEHYGDPRAWLAGDQWDTVMNYDAFMEPLTWFLTGMEKHSDGKNENLLGDATGFFNTMKYHMSKLMQPSLQVAMNELSNHDHSRFLTRTNGQVGRTSSLGPEAAEKGVKKSVMKEAVVFQMTWPGAPTVYYGDEAGVCGWTDPDNRRTYPWGHEDMDLLNFHKKIIAIHRENISLKRGSLVYLHEDYNVISYGRFCRNEAIVVVINNNDYDKDVSINVMPTGLAGDKKINRIFVTHEEGFEDEIAEVTLEKGRLNYRMPQKSAVIFKGVTE